MFDREIKLSQFMQEKTASQFGDNSDDSVVYEVEAEREYVGRLKVQREKIEGLYSKYDLLLKDLKSRDVQLKEKDKTINSLESKCQNLSFNFQESSAFKQQNHDIKSENVNLQRAISELEDSYTYLHGQFKSKEVVSGQKYDEMEYLNDELLGKMRTLTKRYQEREEEFEHKYNGLTRALEEAKADAKRSKDSLTADNEMLRVSVLQKDQEIKLLKSESLCLKSRIAQLQVGINQVMLEHEERLEHIQKEKKCQLRVLKSEIEQLKEINHTFERKWQKSKEECELKDCSVKEMNLILEDRDRQNCDAMHLMRQEFTLERGALKEQAIQQESLVDRLERRVNELSRKEQSLHGKVKKYEQCMDAKRSLRHVEQQELERISHLLNLQ